MYELDVNITGKTVQDLEVAIEEILKKVKEGYYSGFDSSDNGSYEFHVVEHV